MSMKNKLSNGQKVRNLMRAAQAGFSSPKAFQFAFGKFQTLNMHLSIALQDAANNEFRRVAMEAHKRNEVAEVAK